MVLNVLKTLSHSEFDVSLVYLVSFSQGSKEKPYTETKQKPKPTNQPENNFAW